MADTQLYKEEPLDRKLAELFQRPGLSRHPEMQETISKAAYIWLDILGAQKEMMKKTETPIRMKNKAGEPLTLAERSLERLLRSEHSARIDLNVVRWSVEAREQLLTHSDALADYKKNYLMPTLKKFNKIDNPTLPEVTDYLMGSTIRIVIDLLGQGNCYVPDSEDPAMFSTELLRRQIAINKVANKIASSRTV